MDTFHPSDVAIVGIVYQPKWYSGRLKSIKHTDKIRGDLILYSLRFAAGLGYKVVIVDGGSAKTMVAEIKKIGGITVLQAKIHKRSPNRRRAIFEASKIPGVKAICMAEIEKVSFITDGIEKAVLPVIKDEADVVVPLRNDSLFRKSYPTYMYESETEGNILYNEALRSHGLLSVHEQDLDVFFGARVFKNDQKMLKYLFSHYEANPFSTLFDHKLFDLEEYSNAQFFPVVKALVNNLRVKSAEVAFVYPEKQKENEEIGDREEFISKRRYQRMTILIELMHFLGYLSNKKGRRIAKA